MDCRSPSSPVARALASSSGTPIHRLQAHLAEIESRWLGSDDGAWIGILPEQQAHRFLPALRFLRGHLLTLAGCNARRPYSGLETQAPDRASKGEGMFSAAAGTLQHPL
jgi:hypothetical protein